MPPLSLSIALLTRNRPASLERCLASVRSQSHQPDEIVISDDSEGSDRAAVRHIAQRWDCRYIPGPQRGLYANRNYTALACTGTHIRTMDDDHRLPPGHLEHCWQAIHHDPAAIWTTGERSYVEGEFYYHSDRANQLSPSGVGIRIPNPDENWGIADGSTIYPRAIFDQGLRMVDAFNSYGESFLEFGVYLYRHGLKSRCIPGAYVEHYADRLTLTRRPRGMYVSRLYASIAFNRYFMPNRRRLLRYCLTYSRHLAPRWDYLPRTWAQVRDRWHDLPATPLPQC